MFEALKMKQERIAKIVAETKPEMKEVFLESGARLGGIPTDPEEFIEYFQAIIAKIPECAKDAQIELSCDNDYGADFIAYDLKYTRLENPTEVMGRVVAADARATISEQRERQQLAALKAKYEND